MSTNAFNANGGINMIGQMLGTAYDSVRLVADHITEVKKLAENISSVRQAANNMSRNIEVIDEPGGLLGSTTFIELPDGIEQEDVLDFSVVLITSNAVIYGEMGGYFSSKIEEGALSVTLEDTAPLALENATIRWTLSYKVTA